jgi:hypothetical protein
MSGHVPVLPEESEAIPVYCVDCDGETVADPERATAPTFVMYIDTAFDALQLRRADPPY